MRCEENLCWGWSSQTYFHLDPYMSWSGGKQRVYTLLTQANDEGGCCKWSRGHSSEMQILFDYKMTSLEKCNCHWNQKQEISKGWLWCSENISYCHMHQLPKFVQFLTRRKMTSSLRYLLPLSKMLSSIIVKPLEWLFTQIDQIVYHIYNWTTLIHLTLLAATDDEVVVALF